MTIIDTFTAAAGSSDSLEMELIISKDGDSNHISTFARNRLKGFGFPSQQPVRVPIVIGIESERVDNLMVELGSVELQPIRLQRCCAEAMVPLLRKGAFQIFGCNEILCKPFLDFRSKQVRKLLLPPRQPVRASVCYAYLLQDTDAQVYCFNQKKCRWNYSLRHFIRLYGQV